MRIAVATDDGEHVALHTGRCRGLVIFDVESGSVRRLEERANAFTAHARGECQGTHDAHSSGHQSHGGLIDAIADCGVLITRGLGGRLVADLRVRGIDPFVSQAERVDDAAADFAQGRLARVPGTGCSHPS